ncbi:hypothetical protein D3C85_1668760 [compost metagenome]
MDLRNFAKPRHQTVVAIVHHAAILNEHREIPFPVAILHPTITISVGFKMERTRLLKVPTKTRLQLVNEPLNSAIVNCIFETSMFTNRTIPIITLDHNRFLR